MFTKRLLVLDIETTGLAPASDAIIEIAACVLSPDTLREEHCFHSRVFTDVPVSPTAYAVHGISHEDLSGEPSLAEVVDKFESFAPKDVILCGHNVGFDAAFLKTAYHIAGLRYGFDYHLLDIWSVAFFVLGARGVRTPAHNLTALCSLFGIAREPKHSALQDVRASAAILRHLHSAVRGSEMEVLGQFTLGTL